MIPVYGPENSYLSPCIFNQFEDRETESWPISESSREIAKCKTKIKPKPHKMWNDDWMSTQTQQINKTRAEEFLYAFLECYAF